MMEPGEIDRRFGVTDEVLQGTSEPAAKVRTLSAQFRGFAQYLDADLPETDDTIIAKSEVFRLLEECYEEAKNALTPIEPILEGL